jgi:hypothetical protein
MNLSIGQAASQQRGDIKTSGAGGSLGTAANAGPAHPLTVGAVGFGPNWTTEDSMAASIIRLQCENDELTARVAVLEEEQRIIVRERDEARDTVLALRRQRAAQDALIESLRDEACRESCRDKAAADGGWANI